MPSCWNAKRATPRVSASHCTSGCEMPEGREIAYMRWGGWTFKTRCGGARGIPWSTVPRLRKCGPPRPCGNGRSVARSPPTRRPTGLRSRASGMHRPKRQTVDPWRCSPPPNTVQLLEVQLSATLRAARDERSTPRTDKRANVVARRAIESTGLVRRAVLPARPGRDCLMAVLVSRNDESQGTAVKMRPSPTPAPRCRISRPKITATGPWP